MPTLLKKEAIWISDSIEGENKYIGFNYYYIKLSYYFQLSSVIKFFQNFSSILCTKNPVLFFVCVNRSAAQKGRHIWFCWSNKGIVFLMS